MLFFSNTCDNQIIQTPFLFLILVVNLKHLKAFRERKHRQANIRVSSIDKPSSRSWRTSLEILRICILTFSLLSYFRERSWHRQLYCLLLIDPSNWCLMAVSKSLAFSFSGFPLLIIGYKRLNYENAHLVGPNLFVNGYLSAAFFASVAVGSIMGLSSVNPKS